LLRKVVCVIILVLMLNGMLMLAFNIQLVKASGTIYIRADGSVDPPTAPIQRDGNLYTFTANIYDIIVVQRSDIMIDGARYMLQGYQSGYGFSLSSVSNVTIKRTYIKEFAMGIYINGSFAIVIANNSITSNYYGIELQASSESTIKGNDIATNEYDGVILYDSSYNTIFGNNLTKNKKGLSLWGASGNDVYKNNITNNSVYGIGVPDILVSPSGHNYFFENEIAKNGDGVYFSSLSSHNSLYQNNLTDNYEMGIDVGGGFNHTLSRNNIRNSGGVGVWISKSFNNIISENNIMDSGSQSMSLTESPNNTIFGNSIINNAYGIILFVDSPINIIYGNNIVNNLYRGISVFSSDNKIYHNNFINNTQQAYSTFENNVWDDWYPSGGNYWSDYNGTDLFSGPYQNETGSDGIGDTLYFIEEYNEDRYPLMNPWVPPPTPDFSITASPTSLIIQQGDLATSTITIASMNGFDQPVQLTVSGAPTEVTTTLNPEQVTPPPDSSATSTLTVSVSTTATPGLYALTVTGTSDTLTHSVDISLEITALPVPENQPPVADAGLGKSISSGDLLPFNGSESYDLDGTIVSYRWNFGDGTTAEGKVVSHRFRGAQNEPTIYIVTLTVGDNKGATATDTVSVTVKPLEKSVEVSDPPILAKMTVTYNWIDKSNDEDIYIVSKIHVEGKGFAGTFVPIIWVWEYLYPLAELPAIDFLDYLFIWGNRTEKTYEPPFVTKPIIGISPPITKRTFDEGTFEGFQVKGSDVMSIYAQGFKLKLGWPPVDVELFEFSATSFDPQALATEPSLLQKLLDKLLDELPDLIMGHLGSPGELRVYDSVGRVTGLVNGETKEEIPNSVYSDNTVMILSSSNSYYYEVSGTQDGSYGLLAASFTHGEWNTFTATDIPISTNAIHQYTIDWVALSQGQEEVTVKVDSDGDGVFELTFTSDSELTREEFMLQITPKEAFPLWIVGTAVAIIAIASAAVAVFWRKRKQHVTKG